MAQSLSQLKEDAQAIELANYYSRNYPAMAEDCLKIMPEEGGICPLIFNTTQWDLHERLEAQLSNFGKVRAIILKPRREGLSTYVGGRFYHKTIFKYGIRTRVTAHLDDSTKSLFRMVKLFQRFMPDRLKPSTKEDSANSLSFPINLGSYVLSTARSTESGRSDLAHLFHGSEVAYWGDGAENTISAAVETVGNKPGTEIILESTGAPGTYFEELWNRAQEGGEYMPIFYPWYKSERNRADAEGLILLPEEKELMQLYPGMDEENIAFRRTKLILSSEQKFNREYPATPADAFIADGELAFIKPEYAQMALNRDHEPPFNAPRVLGVDPSQTLNGDYCGMCVRQGNVLVQISKFRREKVQERAAVILNYMKEQEIDFLFIDQGGSGKEIYEMLLQWGVDRSIMFLIPFGMSATNKRLYPNKRVEMYTMARNWLMTEGSIPNNPQFISELSLTKQMINNNGQEVLEPKKNMRKSPNIADAFVLTFAFPVSLKRGIQTTGSYR